MTEQDYLDEIERKSKEIQDAKRAIEDLKKPKLKLEHNAVYRMNNGLVMRASIIDNHWFLCEMKEDRQSQRAAANGDLAYADNVRAVEKIGKLAVVDSCKDQSLIQGEKGNFRYTYCYNPESLTGKKL